MEQIKTVELHIYVYKYTSEEEMNKHILEMQNKGFKVERKGEYNLSKESTIDAFCDDNNWYWVAEFSKSDITRNNQYNHETVLYWFYNQ